MATTDSGFTAVELAAALGQPHAPTPEQQGVIQAPLRPLLVVAGAGSGKTETMAARVVWLIANGLAQPEDVLGLTFTRKAAGELSDRIGRRLAALSKAGLWAPAEGDGSAAFSAQPTISTYHSFAGRIVRDHGLLLGHEPDARLLTEAATWQLAHEAVMRWDQDMSAVNLSDATVTAAVVDLSSELAEHVRTPGEMAAFLDATIARIEAVPRGQTRKSVNPGRDIVAALRVRRAIVPIVERFAALKAQRDLLDFSDQMRIAAQLALAHPQIGQGERDRFRVVLLDEFQDTSHAQLTLLRALFVAAGEPVPVTAVGDPHQSIYGWRGASATTLAAFVTEFADPAPADRLTLSTSWRNDHSVLAGANIVSAPLREPGGLVPVPALQARPGAGEGMLRLARFETVEDESAAVAQWLLTQRSANPAATAAVLCRKRSHFLPIIRALDAAGIPHEVVGLGGLLLTPEVGDVLALLHVVADPTRGDQLMRLLTGPRVNLGVADLDGLAAWARHRQRVRRQRDAGTRGDGSGARDVAVDVAERPSLVEALDPLPGPDWIGPESESISSTALARLADLAGVVDRVRRLTGLPLADLVGEAERALMLDVELLSRPEYSPSASRAHLDAFADVAAQFSTGAERPHLGGFLAWVAAAIDLERGLERGLVETNPAAVQVMTIHAAKGLEWDVVAVPGLTEGTFPDHSRNAKAAAGEWLVDEPVDKAWLGGLTKRGLPYPLRGDHGGLPVLRLEAASDYESLAGELDGFLTQAGTAGVAEERRLAYVALTRARAAAFLSASVWFTGKLPRVTSRFLREVHDAATAGLLGGRVEIGPWVAMPPTDPAPQRPPNAMEDPRAWPHDRYADRLVRAQAAAAGLAAAAVGLAATDLAVRDDEGPASDGAGTAGPLPEGAEAQEVEVLLRERGAVLRRAARTAASDTTASDTTDPVELPPHVSTTALLDLLADPSAFALARRRPIPTAPTAGTRRGTRFHAWIEQYYSTAAFVAPDELPGSADEDTDGELDLTALQETFLASEWADRQPVELETSVETVIDGIAIRGRIDAVFREGPDWVLVDWKTGRTPSGPQVERRAMQLATYAVAWARLREVPAQRVRAAFYFAGDGTTVWPELPDEEQLASALREAVNAE